MIARRYAKALLQLAIKNDRTEEIKRDIVSIGGLVRQKRYSDYFSNRMVSAASKLEVFASLDPLTRDFLRLVIKNKREEYLYLISREYVGLLNKKENVIDVDAVSRVALSAAQRDALKQKLMKYLGKNINLSLRTDKKLLGGIKLQYDGRVMNGTVSGMLSDLLGQMVKD